MIDYDIVSDIDTPEEKKRNLKLLNDYFDYPAWSDVVDKKPKWGEENGSIY